MKKKFVYLASLCLLTTMACQANPVPPLNANAPLETGQSSAVYINNDSQSLKNRVQRTNKRIPISRFGVQSQDQQDRLELELIAEVLPPEVQGQRVQATNVDIEGHLAYVSYDVAGPDFSGGIYIIDISNPREPQLKAELLRSDLDYYAIEKHGNQLLLPGALEEAGATLGVVELNAAGDQFVGEKELVYLPSYAATDVETEQGKAYVTVGDEGGGVAMLDLPSFKHEGFYPMADARSIDNYRLGNSFLLGAFAGTPGRLHLLSPEMEEMASYRFPQAATLPVSKSTVDIVGHFAYLGAGDGGTMSVDLRTGRTVQQHKPPQGITNGVAIPHDPRAKYAFMAEGEDGVSIARIERDSGEFKPLGSLDFEEAYSSNMLAYQDQVLFVANGNGGLSILSVKEKAEESSRYQSVFIRQFDDQNENGTLTVFKGRLRFQGDVKIAGVVYDTHRSVPNLKASDRLFASAIDPELPEMLNQADVRHYEKHNPDYARIVDEKTLDFSTGITHGADDFRVILDYGTTPLRENSFQIELDADMSTDSGMIVGSEESQGHRRQVQLSNSSGIIVDQDFTTVTQPHRRKLIVMREGAVDSLENLSFQIRR